MSVERPYIWWTLEAAPWLLVALAISIVVPVSNGQEASKPKQPSGFTDGRRGDVPEGTLEMLTPETDKAIQL